MTRNLNRKYQVHVKLEKTYSKFRDLDKISKISIVTPAYFDVPFASWSMYCQNIILKKKIIYECIIQNLHLSDLF